MVGGENRYKETHSAGMVKKEFLLIILSGGAYEEGEKWKDAKTRL